MLQLNKYVTAYQQRRVVTLRRTYILDKSAIIPILRLIEQNLNWRARNLQLG